MLWSRWYNSFTKKNNNFYYHLFRTRKEIVSWCRESLSFVLSVIITEALSNSCSMSASKSTSLYKCFVLSSCLINQLKLQPYKSLCVSAKIFLIRTFNNLQKKSHDEKPAIFIHISSRSDHLRQLFFRYLNNSCGNKIWLVWNLISCSTFDILHWNTCHCLYRKFCTVIYQWYNWIIQKSVN